MFVAVPSLRHLAFSRHQVQPHASKVSAFLSRTRMMCLCMPERTTMCCALSLNSDSAAASKLVSETVPEAWIAARSHVHVGLCLGHPLCIVCSDALQNMRTNQAAETLNPLHATAKVRVQATAPSIFYWLPKTTVSKTTDMLEGVAPLAASRVRCERRSNCTVRLHAGRAFLPISSRYIEHASSELETALDEVARVLNGDPASMRPPHFVGIQRPVVGVVGVSMKLTHKVEHALEHCSIWPPINASGSDPARRSVNVPATSASFAVLANYHRLMCQAVEICWKRPRGKTEEEESDEEADERADDAMPLS